MRIMEQLNSILSELFGLKSNDISDQIAMKETPKWDSLTHMKLIASIEDNFNIELEMDDVMDMTTIGNIRLILKDKYSVE